MIVTSCKLKKWYVPKSTILKQALFHSIDALCTDSPADLAPLARGFNI
jgi:hypothetical protein